MVVDEREKTTVEAALLLNYLTSSTLGSLIRSIGRRHFSVSIGIAGSLLQRLLIIFSTGLFSLENLSITYDKEMVAFEHLNLTKRLDPVNYDSFQPVDTLSYFWGTRSYNLPLTHGTTAEFAIQSFEPLGDDLYDTVAADVQVFESRLENCETFTFNYSSPSSKTNYHAVVEPVLPVDVIDRFKQWCDFYGGSIVGLSGAIGEFLVDTGFSASSINLVYKCSEEASAEAPGHKYAIFVGLAVLYPGEARWRISGALCEPTHSLTRRTVTNVTDVSRSGDPLHVPTTPKEVLDLGREPNNITKDLWNTIFYELDLSFSILNDTFSRYEWYNLLNITEPRRDLMDWANATLVTETSQKVWSAIAALGVKKNFASPSNHTVHGTATSIQSRLCIQQLSLRLIETLLALLALFSVALHRLFPGVHHGDPGSVGSHALILAKSRTLQRILTDGGLASGPAVTSRPRRCTVSITTQRTASTVPTSGVASDEGMQDKPNKHDSDVSKWWQPLTATTWYRTTVLATASAIIVALEVLFQTSKRNHGIADVIIQGHQRYTWTYTPALVMALVGLTFVMADFTARLLHPFQVLRRDDTAFKEMLYDPACQVSLVAATHAARKRQFALLATILTSLMAPILNIITSGLYTPTTVPRNYDVTMDVTGWFDIKDNPVRYVDEDADYDFVSLVQHTDVLYPKWTHGPYVFSTFDADRLHARNGNDSALTLSARLPAVRAKMNCSLIDYWEPLPELGPDRDVLMDPPSGCHPPLSEINDTRRKDSKLSFSLLYDPVLYDNGYFVDDARSLALSNGHLMDVAADQVCGDLRNHYWYIAGHRHGRRSFDTLTILHCNPYIEALYIDVNLSLPSVRVASEVIPDEDSAVFLSAALNATQQPGPAIAQFLHQLVDGTGSMPVQSLVGRANIDNLKARLEDVYSIYIADILHRHFRRSTCALWNDYKGNASARSDPATISFATDPIHGTVVDGTRLRLVQNAISTRILEGLLAAMLLCATVAWILERHTRILPIDPGCIAAKMSLFADAEVWRDETVVEELREEERGERAREELFEGWVFRMGWWGGREEDEEVEKTGDSRFGVDATKVSVDDDSASVSLMP